MRELTIDELDIVSGGGDPNFHYCANGPAGEGLYPNYVSCGKSITEIVEAVGAAVVAVGKGLGGGAGKPPT